MKKADGVPTKFANGKFKHTRDQFGPVYLYVCFRFVCVCFCSQAGFTVISAWSLFLLKGCINFN